MTALLNKQIFAGFENSLDKIVQWVMFYIEMSWRVFWSQDIKVISQILNRYFYLPMILQALKQTLLIIILNLHLVRIPYAHFNINQ